MYGWIESPLKSYLCSNGDSFIIFIKNFYRIYLIVRYEVKIDEKSHIMKVR